MANDTKNAKVYIHYSYPDRENAAILEVWSSGQKPKKKLWQMGECIIVFDSVKGQKELINARDWDGEE